jgi:hypothetical protein
MPKNPPPRFSPPPLDVDSATRWVLQRAFGPPDMPLSAAETPGDALQRAGALGVGARIGARTAAEVLTHDLDTDTAATFGRQTRQALEAALAYDALAATLAEHAAALGAPIVLLKGHALHAGGHAAPGSRTIGDLDILVAEPTVEPLHRALRQAGFRAAPGAGNEQHLPPLAAPGWGIVDLHYLMRGVGDPSTGWLDATAVLSIGEPPEVIPNCWVPDRLLLAAHALAHGIEQHASSPLPYPLPRMIADLTDLLPDEQSWSKAMTQLEERLRTSLQPGELESARDLALGLASGNPLEDLSQGARQLLAHLLAHALDEEYRASLRGHHRRHRWQQARQRGTLLRYANRKLLDLWRRVVAGP